MPFVVSQTKGFNPQGRGGAQIIKGVLLGTPTPPGGMSCFCSLGFCSVFSGERELGSRLLLGPSMGERGPRQGQLRFPAAAPRLQAGQGREQWVPWVCLWSDRQKPACV